jgi:hypothetical protein
MGVRCYVTKDIFEAIVASHIQLQCLKAISKLVVKLHAHFPQHGLRKALNILYLHYWLFEECDESFNTHLNLIKTLLCIYPH